MMNQILNDKESLEDRAFDMLKEFKRITTALVIRLFRVTAQEANRICDKVRLRQHLEARKLAKEINGG